MSKRSPKNTWSLIVIALGLLLFLLLAFVTNLPAYIAWVLGWTVITFGLYGYDKSQAGRSGARVPEIVLHGAALVGGFIGGWAGMYVFHHKTQKPIFKVVLLIATAINGFIFYWFFLRG